MPRNKWVLKNRYCRRSKFKEKDFKLFVDFYFVEALFGFKRKEWRMFYSGKYFSMPAASEIYEKLGQYIWDRFIADLYPSFRQEDVFDELLDLIYGKIVELTKYNELFYSADNWPLRMRNDSIASSLMFHLLEERSKVIRGFKRDKFYLEFSRVFFICKVIKENNLELLSLYSIEKPKIDAKIFKLSVNTLLSLLEEYPL